MKILMYHSIVRTQSSLPPDREEGAEIYDVKLGDFKDQMHWLKEEGVPVVTLEQAGQEGEEEAVVLSFDDGEMNNFDEAFEILKAMSFPAYFFIIAERIGRNGYMNAGELKELHRAGMVVGSHGLTHRKLTDLNADELEKELRDSKEILEYHLGTAVEDFSVPRGFYNDDVLRRAKEAGYRHIFVSDGSGLPENSFPRTAVRRGWDVAKFRRTVLGKESFSDKVSDTARKTGKAVLPVGLYERFRSAVARWRR